MALVHLSQARLVDSLPRLIGLAADADAQGRVEDWESLCDRAAEELAREESGAPSRRDAFICAAMQGVLAGEGARDDAGRLAVQLAEEALEAADDCRGATLEMEPPPAVPFRKAPPA
jgi:hypothetical protein